MTAGDLARRAGSIERTGTGAVAECLGAVAALARIPLIDDHLHRHLASPQAGGALLLVGSCRQSPVTALAVDRKRRCNTTPRWWRCLFRDLPFSNFRIADLVELNDLETRIGNRQCFAGDGSTHLELHAGPPSRSRLPSSEQLKTRAMPAEEGLGLDVDQGILPCKKPREQNHR